MLAVLLFALVTWQVAAHGPLRVLDERAGRAAAASGAVPGSVAEFLADLGNTVVAVPVLAAAALWTGLRSPGARRWLPPLAAALAMAAVPALIVPLKAWIARPGPPTMGGDPGFFPSGHAATAAVAYGGAALLLLRRRRWPWAVGCVLLNAGVALGLVLRGYHWPLDVAGAWCLSAAVLWGLSCRIPGRPCPSP